MSRPFRGERMGILQSLPNWIAPTDPPAQHRVNLVLAWAWLTFGIWGLVNYATGWSPNLADSIPVLFIISVYANFTGHLSTAQAARVEINRGS
jgi:hypothetical protein